MIRTLIRIEWQQQRNTWAGRGVKSYIGLLITSILGLFFLWILSYAALSIGTAFPNLDIAPVLTVIFLMGFILVLLLGIPQVFKNLFSSTDLETLFTMPISPKAIFFVKYVKSFFGMAGVIWLLEIIPLFVLASSAGYSWLFYPLVFLIVTALMVSAVSLTFLFNLGLIQILPASRAKELMTIMSGMAGIMVYLVIQIPNLASNNGFSPQNMENLMHLPAWLPTTLAAHGVTLAASGDAGMWLPVLLLVVIAAFLALLSSTLVERGFRRGWVRMNEGGSRKKSKHGKHRRAGLHHPVTFIGIKEWLTIRRDLREWMTIIPLFLFIGIFLMNMFTTGGGVKEMQKIPFVIWLVLQAVFLFIFGLFSGNLTTAAVGREGKAGWILQGLPLSGRDIALGKYWVSWLIPLVILGVMEILFGLFLGWSAKMIALGIFVFAILSLGLNGIALWIGTLGARYDPNNPQNRVTPGLRWVFMLVTLVYVALAAIPALLMGLPASIQPFVAKIAAQSSGFFHLAFHWTSAILEAKASHEVLIFLTGALILAIYSIGLAVLSLYLSAKRFDAGIQIQILQNTGGKGLMKSSLSRNKF